MSGDGDGDFCRFLDATYGEHADFKRLIQTLDEIQTEIASGLARLPNGAQVGKLKFKRQQCRNLLRDFNTPQYVSSRDGDGDGDCDGTIWPYCRYKALELQIEKERDEKRREKNKKIREQQQLRMKNVFEDPESVIASIAITITITISITFVLTPAATMLSSRFGLI